MLKQFLILLTLILMPALSEAQKGQFLTVDEYRSALFDTPVSWQTLWITKETRAEISQILGRQFSGLRIRYLGQDTRTAWVFEEIGKELPITVGVAVGPTGIEDLTVLEFRESRGGEVRYSFFTDQFLSKNLSMSDDYPLDGSIDGITGATLSVRALKKIARLALFCHQLTPFSASPEAIAP